MTLPRFCKICRLILHYPDLTKEDYDEDSKSFNGKGYCPAKHYEISLRETDEETKIIEEKFQYNEYMLIMDYEIDNWAEIWKDGRIALVTTMESVSNINYMNVEYIVNKLDTLVNFS